MGNSWPKLKELTAIELYNKLQEWGRKSDFFKPQKTIFTPPFSPFFCFCFFAILTIRKLTFLLNNSDFDTHTHTWWAEVFGSGSDFLWTRPPRSNSKFWTPSLKTTSSLKIDGWNDSFLLGWRIFKHYVSLRECKFTFLVPKDTRELILVVDATLEDCGDVNEEAEVSFLSPERFKQLLLKVQSLLFDNFTMECCDHGGCWPQSFSDSDNNIGRLWTRIFQWSSSRFRSCHAEIFPGNNMSYLLGWLKNHKKSLRFHKVNQPNLRISKQINHGACIGPVWCMFNCILISRILSDKIFKQWVLWQVISKRRARGWTVVVMGDDNKTRCARDLQHWIYKHGFGSCDDSSDLVKDVCELEGAGTKTSEVLVSKHAWVAVSHCFCFNKTLQWLFQMRHFK